MGRLAGILQKATDARLGLETAVEKDVAGYIERVDGIHKRRETIFAKHHGALDADVGDLAELEKDLEDFGKNDRSGEGGSAYVGTTAKG